MKIARKLRFPFLQETAFFGSVTPLYGATLLLIFYAAQPFITPTTAAQSFYNSNLTYFYKTETIEKTNKEKPTISGYPASIHIPKIGLMAEIIPGKYDPASGTWNISDMGIHYAELSSPVNDSGGNTLIYAHNNQWAFGPLYLLEKGDQVEIKTSNGYLFRYSFVAAEDFDPNNTSLFSYAGAPILTLQTCSGYFNEFRRLYNFNLTGVEKV